MLWTVKATLFGLGCAGPGADTLPFDQQQLLSATLALSADQETAMSKARTLKSGGELSEAGLQQYSKLVNDAAGRQDAWFLERFDSSSDHDWFRVDLAEQEDATFHTAPVRLDGLGGVDTIVEVFDNLDTGYAALNIPAAEDRFWMRSDDDGGFGLYSTAHFAAPRTATYFVRVRGYGGGTGPYALYVQRMGNFVPAAPVLP